MRHVQLIFVIICEKRTEYYANEIWYTYTHKAVRSHRLWSVLFRWQRFSNRVYFLEILAFVSLLVFWMQTEISGFFCQMVSTLKH